MLAIVRFCAPGALLLLAALAPSGTASAQGAIQSGIRGKVTIASRLLTAEEWVIDENKRASMLEPARVRRPSPHGVLGQPTEPNPPLKVVLQGVKTKQAPDSFVAFESLRFSPRQVLVLKPGKLVVENRHATAITLVGPAGKELLQVPAGQKAAVELPAGEQVLSVKEFSFVRLATNVMDDALFLPVEKNGTIPPIPVESGEYKIGFYHGASPLSVVPVLIPGAEYVAVVATVSDNRVVTVNFKDGGLKVSMPPRRVVADDDEEP